MPKMPSINCPTLDAVDRAIEAAQDVRPREYLGMSSIGDSCLRKLWYGFRWASPIKFSADVLKRFHDGHRGEDLQAERLRMVEGLELHTHDSDGKQFGFTDFGGHFAGHMDGAIAGLLQAPKTWHVWEHKQVDEKSQAQLDQLKIKNEKAALSEWKPTYYAQAVLYMSYSGMSRHYLTVATPGGRRTIGVRTNEDPKAAIQLKQKALAVIKSKTCPEKLSESPAWFECKWCDKAELCHGLALPQVNCRTCVHATPETDQDGAVWSCARHRITLTRAAQEKACREHIFIPQLLRNHAEAIDADAETLTWVEYQKPNGETFKNGSAGTLSRDIAEALK